MKKLRLIFLGMLMLQVPTLGAMELDPVELPMQMQRAARRFTTRVMQPREMKEANIYNPNEICPVCQETLNEDQPIIAIHCAPNASTVNGRYHSCHAACLREWWQNRQEHVADKTCLHCNRMVPAEVPGAATVKEVFKNHRNKFNRVSRHGAKIFRCVVESVLGLYMTALAFEYLSIFLDTRYYFNNAEWYRKCVIDGYGRTFCDREVALGFKFALENKAKECVLRDWKFGIICGLIYTTAYIIITSIIVQQEEENILLGIRRHSPVGDSIKLFKKLIKDLVLYFNNDPELIRFFNEGGVIELQPRNS